MLIVKDFIVFTILNYNLNLVWKSWKSSALLKEHFENRYSFSFI